MLRYSSIGWALLLSVSTALASRATHTVPSSPPKSAARSSVEVKSLGKNSKGWNLFETKNFLIYDAGNAIDISGLAEQIEREVTRISEKWFGSNPPLVPKIELVLHKTARDYSEITGVPATSPGHSRIESDPGSFRVIGRRIDLHVDHPDWKSKVLPHEITHAVMAGKFGRYQIPRWADEGMAILSEPRRTFDDYRRKFSATKEGLKFSVDELMHLENYPRPGRIEAFYSQSALLVNFLVKRRDPPTFAAFLRDGLRDGYESSLRKHYQWTTQELQEQFNRSVEPLGAPFAPALEKNLDSIAPPSSGVQTTSEPTGTTVRISF